MKKISIFVLLFSIIMVNVCFATDDFLYPGTNCQHASGPTPAEQWGAWMNPSSTATLNLTCPVDRDQTTKTISNGYVKLVDKHYSLNCTARLIAAGVSSTTGGIYYYASPLLTTSGSSNLPQIKYSGTVYANPITPAYWWVTIPPTYSGNRSAIISYWVNENN